MGINPNLIAALILQLGIPEFFAWLKSRNGSTITDSDILAKLGVDADTGIAKGEAWLVGHPDA